MPSLLFIVNLPGRGGAGLALPYHQMQQWLPLTPRWADSLVPAGAVPLMSLWVIARGSAPCPPASPLFDPGLSSHSVFASKCHYEFRDVHTLPCLHWAGSQFLRGSPGPGGYTQGDLALISSEFNCMVHFPSYPQGGEFIITNPSHRLWTPRHLLGASSTVPLQVPAGLRKWQTINEGRKTPSVTSSRETASLKQCEDFSKNNPHLQFC